jgi:copper transport protein
VIAGLVAALAMTVASAVTASAHAYLLASNPGNGAILDAAPAQAILQFSVPVTVSLSSAILVDGRGLPVPGAAVRQASGNSSVLVVNLPTLPKGGYRLTYRTWDSIDLHQTGGSIDFGIGQAAAFAADPSTAASPSYAETGTRWLELAGIALLIGVATVWLGVLPGLRRFAADALQPLMAHARRRLLLLSGIGYLAIVAGKVGQLAVAIATLGPGAGAPVPDLARTILLGSGFGQLWLLGMALAIASVLAIRAAIAPTPRGRRRSRWPDIALVAATLGLIVVYAQSSHGTNQGGFDPAQVVFRIVHLTAAGVWVGGLTVLTALFAGPLRRRTTGPPLALAAFRQYGWLAVTSVGALAASGLVLAGAGVASPEALVTSTYGWTLIAKGIAVVTVMAIGLRHSRLLGRYGGRPAGPGEGDAAVVPLSRSLALEVAGMLIVLWGAAALGATAPAPAQSAPATRAVPLSAPILRTNTTTQVDDLSIQLSMTPGHPGANTLFMQLTGSASVPFRKVTEVRVTLTQPGRRSQTVTGTFIGRARYTFPQVRLDDPGQLSVSVLMRRNPGPDARLAFNWPITPGPSPFTSLGLPTTPWAPVLDVVAGGIGLLVLGWLLAGTIRGRRRGSGSTAAAA